MIADILPPEVAVAEELPAYVCTADELAMITAGIVSAVKQVHG